MNSFLKDIEDFHKKFELIYDGRPRILPERLADFRIRFMNEELAEYMMANEDINRAQALDALVDLVYVALGTAYLHGFPFEEAWKRVHSANMTKIRQPSKRSSEYDVVKPDNFVPPNHDDLVK